MNKKIIRLSYPKIDLKVLKTIKKILKSGYLTQGEIAKKFELLVSNYLGVKHAVATSSCTTALHLTLHSLGVGNGDEVIIPDFTFPATANAVIQSGAVPKIVDVKRNTFNIDPMKIEEAITNKTKAILIVHVFGMCVEMTQINEIAKKHNLFVIEDSACAIGSVYKGKKAGNLGDVACFSFHPRKVITTGEGGMITTQDAQLSEKIRRLASHGSVRKPEQNFKSTFIDFGFNYRMSDLNAALGLVEMERIEKVINKRRKLAQKYIEILKNHTMIQIQEELPFIKSNYQAFVLILDSRIDRDSVIRRMNKEGIETTIGTYSLVSEPVFWEFDVGQVTVSKSLAKSSIALPLHENISFRDINFITCALKNIIRELVEQK